jgi:sRNA-binding carbon storage regulator CsrA
VVDIIVKRLGRMMLILSRSVGQALVIGHDVEVTVRYVDSDSAAVTVTQLLSPKKVTSMVLRHNEPVMLLPGVQIQFLELSLDRAAARLGLVVPKEMSVFRKEKFDSMPGQSGEGGRG